nr:uncharacterized protein LOC106691804 [Halyomorpha halys]
MFKSISKVLTPEVLDFIPKFEGSYNLTHFINTCEEIYFSYCNKSVRERDYNQGLLFNAAMYNLDSAAESLACNYNCNHIKGLIKLLKRNFSDNRSIPDLMEEITWMKPYPKEHPINFLNRLEEKRINLFYIMFGCMTGYELENLTHELNYTLVITLINGVHPLLRWHLESFQIEDLDDARDILMNKCGKIFKRLKYNRSLVTNDSAYTETYTHYSMSYEFQSYERKSYHRRTFQNNQNQYRNYSDNYQIQPRQNIRKPSRNYHYQSMQYADNVFLRSYEYFPANNFSSTDINVSIENHQSEIKGLVERLNTLSEKFDKLIVSSNTSKIIPSQFELISIGNSPPYFIDYKDRKWSVVTGSEKSYVNPALVLPNTKRYREDFIVKTPAGSCNGSEYIYFNLEYVFSEAKSVKLYLMDFPNGEYEFLLGYDVLSEIGVSISIGEGRLTYKNGSKRLIF